MRLVIPGRNTYDLTHLILDMNGTLGLDGELLDGVAERLVSLHKELMPVMVTADTHGGASRVGESLGIETVVLTMGNQAEEKLKVLRRLGARQSAAIGNGANDALMLEESAVGICVVGAEGAATVALLAADVVVTDIRDALDLLLKPQRLAATLRV